MATGKALVLGDDTRSFLAIVRSLGRRGITLHAAPINFYSVALRSRFIKKIHALHPPFDSGAEWVSSLEELVRKENYDLVIPCSDRMLLPLHHNRHRFVGLTRLAIPATDHTDILFDKLRTRELAASLGINLAHSIRPNQSFDAAEVFTRLGAPVVVKPRCSVRATVLQRQEQVRIVATPEELGAAIAGREPSGYFFEAFFPGTGLGLSVLADRGVILQSFQHHRVHQAPRGGSSAYRVSAPIHGDLFAACRKVISHLNYTGVAMFEFRRDSATGNWVLLEVNARPWGSMPLPVALGVDFPFAWYQLLTTSERVPQQSYRAGIYGRNLELDIDFAAKHLPELGNWRQRVVFLARWFLAFHRVLIGREKIDTFAADDSASAIAECRAIASGLIQRGWEWIPGHRKVRRTLACIKLRRAVATAVRAGKTPSIVFVCYGNICRSAFAERSLAKAMEPLANRVLVSSAGTYPIAGRSSPREAIQTASHYSIDLTSHQSQCINDQILDAATVLIVFDRFNLEMLKIHALKRRCPIIRLGSLICAGNRGGDIHDPYGGGPAMFEHTFALIEQGVTALRARIYDIFLTKFPT